MLRRRSTNAVAPNSEPSDNAPEILDLPELRRQVDELRKQMAEICQQRLDSETHAVTRPLDSDVRHGMVSLFLCVPVVIHLVLLIAGFSITLWWCRPDGTCPVPTKGPVRLGSYFNFFTAMIGFVPVFLSLLYIAAMRHASDTVAAHLSRTRSVTIHHVERAMLEQRVKQPSMTQRVLMELVNLDLVAHLLLILTSQGSDGSVYFGPASASPLYFFFLIFIVVVIIALRVLVSLMLRNLRVLFVRQNKEKTRQAFHGSILRSMAKVLAFQGFCATFMVFVSILSPQAARSGVHGEWYPTCVGFAKGDPLIPGQTGVTLNATYIEHFCQTAYDLVTDSPVLQCDDGGFDRFTSQLASCRAYNVAWSLVARVWCVILAGLGAWLAIIIPQYVHALDEQLTWTNWPRMASPRVLAAILHGLMGALGSSLLFFIVIVPVLDGLDNLVRVTRWTASIIAAIGWVGAMLLLAAEFGFHKFADYQKQWQEQRAEAVRVEREIARQASRGLCTFWFVKASFIRDSQGAIPKFQDLPAEALEQVELSLEAVVAGDFRTGAYLAVSHRWETSNVPDEDGEQTRQIREYLAAHSEAKLVWYDFW